MTNPLFEYVAWQAIIWFFLIAWIWFVAKLGEKKAERERKKAINTGK